MTNIYSLNSDVKFPVMHPLPLIKRRELLQRADMWKEALWEPPDR